MPLFYQHNINDETRLAIWRIEETENFFSGTVALHRNISHPHKRLQHLAGRYLLPYLFPGFPLALIKIADTRKPFLSNEAYHFSISHCGEYAAAAVSTASRVGIDIELMKPVIEKVKHKFLGDDELVLLNTFKATGDKAIDEASSMQRDETLLTVCWSGKESVYKWYGEGGIDFKKHIKLSSLLRCQDDQVESAYVFSKETPVLLNVVSTIFGELVLSVVIR